MNTLKMIDRYAILGKIGQGGMSTVYRAFDPETQNGVARRDVAIKLLRETLRDDDELRGRFSQEAKLLSELRHPAIIPLLDYGEVNGRLYFVMPYMESGSLKDWLEEGVPPFAKTVSIINQIAAGLDEAHRRDIIHRDIKPHNVMLEEDGTAYLSDFGVARLIDHDKPEQTMTLIGTPEYMAPEQVLEGKLSCQTDIYQLGVVVFQMLTGERPFEGAVHSVMSQHLNAPIPSAEARNPKLPQGCDEVVQKAMAKKPEDRFSSATELAQALQACTTRQPAKPRVVVPPLPDLVPVPQTKANTVLGTASLDSVATGPSRATTQPNPLTPVSRPKRKSGKMMGVLGLGAAIVSLGLFAMGGLPVGAPNGPDAGNGGNNLPLPAFIFDQGDDDNDNELQNSRRGDNNNGGDNDGNGNNNGGGNNNGRNNNGGNNNGQGGGNAELQTEEAAVAEIGAPPVMDEAALNSLLTDTTVAAPAITEANVEAGTLAEATEPTSTSTTELDTILAETVFETQNSVTSDNNTDGRPDDGDRQGDRNNRPSRNGNDGNDNPNDGNRGDGGNRGDNGNNRDGDGGNRGGGDRGGNGRNGGGNG